MREPELTLAVLGELDQRGDLPFALWLRVVRRLGHNVPISIFFTTLYRLRNESLVNYDPRKLTDEDLHNFIETTRRPPGTMTLNNRGSEIAITVKGRCFANPIVDSLLARKKQL